MKDSLAAAEAASKTGRLPSVALAVTRCAFALVLCINLLCAVQFIAAPSAFSQAYELAPAGMAGEAAIRGMGIAFLMWNTTYPLFIAQPTRFPALGAIILAQQLIGLAGESLLLLSLPPDLAVLSASIKRFIFFDGAGFVLMAASFLFLRTASNGKPLGSSHPPTC